ncbi:MAG: M48 family metalloprotease [Planctomycetes bacterium]|nr:M48 family metalloprotease [Planctomycetota bacterium]
MFPVLQFLIAVFLAKVYLHADKSCWLEDTWWTPLGTLLAVLAVLPVGAWVRGRLAAGLARARTEPLVWEPALRRLYRLQSLFRAAPIASYLVVCEVLGWPRSVAKGVLGGTILLDLVAALLPFLGAQGLAWVQQCGMDRLLTGRFMRLWPYLRFHARQVALPMTPVLGLLVLWDLIEASIVLRQYLLAWPFVAWLLVLAVLTGIYLFSGPLMRLVFGTRRLPDGPLRARLEAFAERVGFSCRDLLVWDTGLELVNAAIVGGLARLRYVMFTEGMVASFTPEEVEAVLAHEVGHAKGGHIHLYFVFALSLLFLFLLLVEGLARIAPPGLLDHEWTQIALFVLTVLVYWRGIFGVVSRRFEREADLFAAMALGDPRRFTDALEEVARKGGGVRTLPSWRHYSIAERVAFLERAFADVAVLNGFRRAARRVKGTLVTVFLVAAALSLRDVDDVYASGRCFLGALRAMEAEDLGGARAAIARSLQDPALAAPLLYAAAEYQAMVRPADPQARNLLILAEAFLAAGEPERARNAVAKVAARVDYLLERGDVAGALALFRMVRESRGWGLVETAADGTRLLRRLRQARDGESAR